MSEYIEREKSSMKDHQGTRYPSIEQPWLKYYTAEQLCIDLPSMNVYEYMKQCNIGNENKVALDYEFISITYGELFKRIDAAANSLTAMGIKEGDTITSCLPNIPEAVYLTLDEQESSTTLI